MKPHVAQQVLLQNQGAGDFRYLVLANEASHRTLIDGFRFSRLIQRICTQIDVSTMSGSNFTAWFDFRSETGRASCRRRTTRSRSCCSYPTCHSYMVISPAAYDHKLTSDPKIKLIFQSAWATDHFEKRSKIGREPCILLLNSNSTRIFKIIAQDSE